MKLVKILLMVNLTMLLCSCSYFSEPSFGDQSKKYLDARSIPPLKIPPGLSSDAFQSKYPASNYYNYKAAAAVTTVPPGLTDKN